jgi:hypothetical protein
MSETWILCAFGGLLALFMGRSAIIACWPDSAAARFCEFQLGFMEPSGEGGDGDCDGDGGGD